MFTPPQWYKPLEKFFEASAPLMIVAWAVITAVGLYLIISKRWGSLAVWLTYLLMP